jgi:hypothetical protein
VTRDHGRQGVHLIQESLQLGPDPLRPPPRRGAHLPRSRDQGAQVLAFGRVEAEDPRQRVQDLRGRLRRAALFEPYVVVDADPGELRQLLAAQARDPAARTGRDPHALGGDPRPA